MSILNESESLSLGGLGAAGCVSPLISQLGQFLTDCPLEFLAALAARLSRLGISTMSQLGDVKVTADGDPNHRAWHKSDSDNLKIKMTELG